METTPDRREGTYEDRYRSLGYLFYSIAGCDRRIIPAEIDALKRMVEEHWLVDDRSYDDLGIGSARYIDVTFDHALDQRMSAKAAYARFTEEQLKEPERFNGGTKHLILRTAEIAKTSGSVNRSEAPASQNCRNCSGATLDTAYHIRSMCNRPTGTATMRILFFTLTLVAGLHSSAQQDTSTYIYRSLQEALEHPSKVLRLDLSDKRLEEFPPEILLMTNLEELRLRNDGIRSLPPGIGALGKLRMLDLSGNPIAVLPDEFIQLRSLEVLLLNDDPALDLDHDIELLTRLPRLRILELRGDGIRQLPACISRMEHLEELYLNNNQLQAFPQQLERMRALKLIDLSTNPIQPLIPLDLQQRGVLVRF